MKETYTYAPSMFIGESMNGRATPVFFDPHSSIFNKRPPGCLITGEPGSGKTFFASMLAINSAVQGKTTIVLDPKGDFLSLYNFKEILNNEVKMVDLTHGRPGLLDPFNITKDPVKRLTLCISVIDLFTGGLSADQTTAIAPIIQDVNKSKNPTLVKVVEELRGSTDSFARNLGTQLHLISQLKYAELCFSPPNVRRKPLSIEKGLTVISIAGLDLPQGVPDKSNKEQCFASGIMYLITDFIKNIMHDSRSKNPKTLIIDEAHVVVSSQSGAKTVKEVALMGRSKKLALVLITQNLSHMDQLDIENTISSRFAFASSSKEGKAIAKAMNLPEDGNFEETIISLNKGECLMHDVNDRHAKVDIQMWNPTWTKALTSPIGGFYVPSRAKDTVSA